MLKVICGSKRDLKWISCDYSSMWFTSLYSWSLLLFYLSYLGKKQTHKQNKAPPPPPPKKTIKAMDTE